MNTPEQAEGDELTDEQIDAYGFVLASQYRTGVVHALEGRTNGLTPSRIAQYRSRRDDVVIRALDELRDADVVECLTPDRHKGRLYALTDRGRAIAPHVTEAQQDG